MVLPVRVLTKLFRRISSAVAAVGCRDWWRGHRGTNICTGGRKMLADVLWDFSYDSGAIELTGWWWNLLSLCLFPEQKFRLLSRWFPARQCALARSTFSAASSHVIVSMSRAEGTFNTKVTFNRVNLRAFTDFAIFELLSSQCESGGCCEMELSKRFSCNKREIQGISTLKMLAFIW